MSRDRGEPVMVYSEAWGKDIILGYRKEMDREMAKSEKQQREMDASRKPLTDVALKQPVFPVIWRIMDDQLFEVHPGSPPDEDDHCCLCAWRRRI